MTEKVTRRLVARGRVQGVWFRESMRIEAERLGVAGWVRNRLDGSVEALLHGPPDRLEALLQWLRQGVPAARVDTIEVAGLDTPDPPPSGFERRPTA